MRLELRTAVATWCALWCASASPTTYWTKEDRAAFEECLVRWKDVDGAWEGQLLTPGAEVGGPYDKRIHVRLVFSRNGTTLLVRDVPQRPWKKVGDDPSPAISKTKLLVSVQGSDAKDPRGHQISFERVRESSAKLIYSRGPIDPKPGETVSMGDMRSGVVVREGTTVPTGPGAEVREQCGPK